MATFKKIRLEASTSLNFASADKCGFSLRSAPDDKRADWAINKVMDKLLFNANKINPATDMPYITAIPADAATVTDLEGAHYEVLGAQAMIKALQKNIKDVTAARTAGKTVYTVIPAFNRVFEYVPGRVNTGGAEASIAGLEDVTDFASDSPLV